MVLLVEDEPSIMRMAEIMLKRIGYQVLAAGTPGQALSLADKNAGKITLLITDVVMPERVVVILQIRSVPYAQISKPCSCPGTQPM
jgi:DNA-binding response OmpR family regulator